MPELEILEFPDPRLRRIAKPVETIDDNLRQLVADMFETMYQAPGIGLAATQVNHHIQLLVMDISEQKDQPICLINPEIIEKEGMQLHEEGCLSVPGQYAKVERAEAIKVKALNLEGESFELEADGLLAVCTQHEMDHLIGKLFVDYLSPMKKARLKKKLEKQRKKDA
ncbi:MAG: peptide deformylase [bacterium]